MPMTRSRVIEPKAEAKIVAKAIDVGSFEPETPVKSGEGLDQGTNGIPMTLGDLSGCEDTLINESRSVRRSMRLASKTKNRVDSEMVSEKVQVSGRKRKCLSTAVKEERVNGSDLELSIPSRDGNGALSLEAEKPVITSAVHSDFGGMKSLKAVGERINEETLELNNSGSSTHSGAIGWDDKNNLNFKKGKRKREPGTEVEFFDFFGLEHAVQNSTEKKSLTLRSGRSIETTDLKRESLQSSKNGENNHDNVCFEVAGSESSGWICNTVAEDAKSKQIEEGCSERIEKFSIEEKGKKEVPEKLSLDSALSLFKLDQEVEKAYVNRTRTRSTTRIDKGKEKLVINEKEDNTKARGMILTSIIPGNDNKGKEKLSIDGVMTKSIGMSGCMSVERVETGTGSTTSMSSIVAENLFQAPDVPIQITRSSTSQNRVRETFRDIAKRNASRFAHFPSAEEDDNHTVGREGEVPPAVVNKETEDWPGPFSTAKKIIKDRQTASMQQNSTFLKSDSTPIVWTPKKHLKNMIRKDTVPSLLDICLCSLSENADAITSLDCVPDVLRHKLSDLLCNSRKMDEHFLGLLVHGSPTEIHVRECSWITEEIFTKTFSGCDTSNLTALHLDLCGASLPDYILSSTLAHSPNCLPSLTSVSLSGAYRLSDAGLNLLVVSAPALRSINLSQCSLLTSNAIHCLASSVGSVLMELYIDQCQGIDAINILPALLQLQNLEVLSLTNIGSVSDDFISKFVPVRGHGMKELILRDCIKLTDCSVSMIAEYCPKLLAIDLSNLNKLTDSALEYLADGCPAIHTLKFGRNGFSDEAVAAYLEVCGEPLRELSLCSITVAHNTATSLARHLKNLHCLDLSWCRKLTNEAFGLIVDNCTNLKVLKVFGCTQISNVFLDGHSNEEVQIIGLTLKLILEHLTPPDYLKGPLRH